MLTFLTIPSKTPKNNFLNSTWPTGLLRVWHCYGCGIHLHTHATPVTADLNMYWLCHISSNEAKAAFVVLLHVERSLCHVFVKNMATTSVSARSATYIQSMCFSAAVRRMMTCVHVRHMRTSLVSPRLYCNHTIGRGLLRMQLVDLDEGCHAKSMCNLQRRHKVEGSSVQGKQDSGDEVEMPRWQKATVDDRLK